MAGIYLTSTLHRQISASVAHCWCGDCISQNQTAVQVHGGWETYLDSCPLTCGLVQECCGSILRMSVRSEKRPSQRETLSERIKDITWTAALCLCRAGCGSALCISTRSVKQASQREKIVRKNRPVHLDSRPKLVQKPLAQAALHVLPECLQGTCLPCSILPLS